jgi:DNA-binding CsgD family transcriptional regulator
MSEPLGIDGLATLFYEAVLEPARWSKALQALVQVAGARGASLSLADFGVPANSFVDLVGQPSEALDAYLSHYMPLDPLLRLGSQLVPGHWLSDWAALGPAYGRTAYYNDFMRVFDNHAVLVAPLALDDEHTALVALQRSRSQGQFAARPDPRLVQLLPHLQRAVRLHVHTAKLREHADFTSSALQLMAIPVMVVDDTARVVLANHAADQLCRHSKLVTIARHRLVATLEETALQDAIRHAATAGKAHPAWLRLRSAPGEEALLLVVSPLPATSPHARAWQRPLAVVMASRSGAGARRIEGVLGELFGLTAAESRVAAALADGMSPAAIAERDGVVVETVRGQIKGVYAKMGVRRQAELSRLVAKLQAILPRSSRA